MGITLGQLAFHIQTGINPSAASAMPTPLAIVAVSWIAVMAIRAHGLVRPALAFLAFALFVPVLRPVGLMSWSAWGTQSVFLWMQLSAFSDDRRIRRKLGDRYRTLRSRVEALFGTPAGSFQPGVAIIRARTAEFVRLEWNFADSNRAAH